jgi:hypothetical protein
LSWLEPIQKQGFAVIPEILTPKEVDELLDEFGRVDLPHSRAGVRHAMKIPTVATVARAARLMEIVQETLGRNAFHSMQHSSTSRRLQTGWWCGTKTRLCRCRSDVRFRVGDHGQ